MHLGRRLITAVSVEWVLAAVRVWVARDSLGADLLNGRASETLGRNLIRMPNSLPEPTLRRALALSLMDGWCMTLFSGFCMSLSLWLGEWSGAAVGACVLSCGITTLCSRKRLLRGDASGMVWLLRAQLAVLAIVFLYVLANLLAYDAAALSQRLRDLQASSSFGGIVILTVEQYGISTSDLEPFLRPMYFAVYLLMMGGTLLFQGGLALFYKTRRGQVTAELAARVSAEQADVHARTSA